MTRLEVGGDLVMGLLRDTYSIACMRVIWGLDFLPGVISRSDTRSRPVAINSLSPCRFANNESCTPIQCSVVEVHAAIARRKIAGQSRTVPLAALLSPLLRTVFLTPSFRLRDAFTTTKSHGRKYSTSVRQMS